MVHNQLSSCRNHWFQTMSYINSITVITEEDEKP